MNIIYCISPCGGRTELYSYDNKYHSNVSAENSNLLQMVGFIVAGHIKFLKLSDSRMDLKKKKKVTTVLRLRPRSQA